LQRLSDGLQRSLAAGFYHLAGLCTAIVEQKIVQKKKYQQKRSAGVLPDRPSILI